MLILIAQLKKYDVDHHWIDKRAKTSVNKFNFKIDNHTMRMIL